MILGSFFRTMFQLHLWRSIYHGHGWIWNFLIRQNVKASIINWIMWRICQLTQFVKILIIRDKWKVKFYFFKSLAPWNCLISNMFRRKGETNNFVSDTTAMEGRLTTDYYKVSQIFNFIPQKSFLFILPNYTPNCPFRASI